MADAQKSTEYANATASPPVFNATTESHGRLRVLYFTSDAIAASAGADEGATILLGRLPAGRVRLLLHDSSAYVNWVTGSATLDLGWEAYTSSATGLAVAQDKDGLVNGLDVNTVGYFTFNVYANSPAPIIAAGGTKLFESKDGVIITATSEDQAIALGDDLVGYLTYVID